MLLGLIAVGGESHVFEGETWLGTRDGTRNMYVYDGSGVGLFIKNDVCLLAKPCTVWKDVRMKIEDIHALDCYIMKVSTPHPRHVYIKEQPQQQQQRRRQQQQTRQPERCDKAGPRSRGRAAP